MKKDYRVLGAILLGSLAGTVLATILVIGIAAIAYGADYKDNRPMQYARDVAPIIYDNCLVCHRKGGIAPMAFDSYEAVRPWALFIVNAVVNRRMPPYDYNIQELEWDQGLNQEEINIIVKWVEQGSLLGYIDELPPLPVFTDGEK